MEQAHVDLRLCRQRAQIEPAPGRAQRALEGRDRRIGPRALELRNGRLTHAKATCELRLREPGIQARCSDDLRDSHKL